ncbi:MAG: hypothetical protein ACTS73_07535 [Arsenophonus sp. NEOnobi-MAG3]
MIMVHCQAITIAKIRAALQISKKLASTLAKRYSISELTVAKWQKQDDVDDRVC